jgi:hypothetical protein
MGSDGEREKSEERRDRQVVTLSKVVFFERVNELPTTNLRESERECRFWVIPDRDFYQGEVVVFFRITIANIEETGEATGSTNASVLTKIESRRCSLWDAKPLSIKFVMPLDRK